jgi:dihydroxyacetone kinase-like protein
MGIHGEPGIQRSKLKPADETVQMMVDKILEDLPYNQGDEVAVLVNGLGATPKEELYVMYRKVAQILKDKSIKVYKVYIGEFATSMEMTGASISFLKLDGELKALLAKPAHSPFFEQVQLEA